MCIRDRLCSADRLAEVDGADEVAAVSLHPLGASVPGLPPRVRDHASEVRVHGDHRDLHLSIRRQRQMCIRDRSRCRHVEDTGRVS